ncbi:MAG: hypothetical protein COW24_00470 [Candidatus Kerfeldbacteria bacterium CG15_BIG_FIL_POST_REV_8_21_14_020_45_12]|uniref:Uncharacterized protein n=1 Tax=Candidatus Kerfeldbacteria bacterium CG15_BIG_FIL_POST_REV_8_21_14_020_45_12 TaxID=2014247 RepID=A0A2M7H589_9BACT|nr:MAG: hypothetical protein COW24_00470 [Candidatus Kerfeldbacteria bacterium CG15_BIG_FIL_POST_REV_8_21_14_020_45_12]PJA93958.1 MAG: hypothetical protein CO132_00775 [Candidatus Kerfeldbacteria bacterium CG_4_9_14_3_um_filter_45_8]
MHRANTVERRKATGKDYAGDPWMVNEVPRGMGCWHQLVWKQNMRGTVTLKGMRDMFVAEYGCDDSTRLGGFKTKPRGKVKEVVDEVAQRQAEAARKEAEATASAEERRRLEEEARQARAQAMVSPDGYIERRGLPNHEDRLNGSIFVVKRARMAVRVVENGALEETCAVPETANLMVVLRPSGDCHDVRVVCGNKVNFGLLMLATRHIAQWTQEGRSFTARGVRAAPKDLLTALAGIA